jgi:RNase P subunit RPR2
MWITGRRDKVMPLMPAFCDNCGTVFSSGVYGDNALQTTFVNCTAGPCPKCGGIGHIPDGVYNLVGSAIEFLSGPQRTIDELKRLSELLNIAKEKQFTPEKINEELEKELPQFLSLLKDILPKTKTELYSFIGLILTAITILINSSNLSSNKTISKTEIQQITQMAINNSIVQFGSGQNFQINQPTIKKVKVGRNDKCPCGSGLKYKKCFVY